MAMPPGGGSSWLHSSDSYQLTGDDDLIWGSVSVPLSRTSLSFMLPYAEDPNTYYDVCAVELEPAGGVNWTYHHPLLEGGHIRVSWTPQTPADQLVPHPQVRRLEKYNRLSPGAPLLATLQVSPGAVSVLDASDTPRLHVTLGALPDPSWPTSSQRGVLTSGDLIRAVFCLPTTPTTRVRIVPTSLP